MPPLRRGHGTPRRAGHILNMSSYSLWMPFPGLALYSASKAYMRSFSVAFAKEVRERGIRVTALCPAGVATDLYGLTPYWQRIGRKLGVLITPDSCARRGLKALWKGRRCIVPDWWNRAWIPFCKVLPMWVLRPVRRFTMKFQNKAERRRQPPQEAGCPAGQHTAQTRAASPGRSRKQYGGAKLRGRGARTRH